MELDTPLKRAIFVTVLILVIAGIGYGIWLVFFSPTQPTPQPPLVDDQPTPSDQLPVAGLGEGQPQFVNINGQLVPADQVEQFLATGVTIEEAVSTLTKPVEQLTKGRVEFVAASNNQMARFYDPNTNRFYRIDPQGHLRQLGDQEFFNVDRVAWAPNDDRAIIQYPDNRNVYYDFETNEQASLPSHWEAFSFNETGDEIAFVTNAIDSQNNQLIIASADGSNPKIVDTIGNANVIVDWSPNDQIVGFELEGESAQRQNLFFIGQNNENFRLTQVEGRDFRHQWSPDGSQLVYSVYNTANGNRPFLWVVGATPGDIGANRRNLAITTWADKCSFSDETTLYCAVPENLPPHAGSIPALHTGKEHVFKIDINSGDSELVAIPQGINQIENIIPTEDENTIFLVERFTNRLYKIDG